MLVYDNVNAAFEGLSELLHHQPQFVTAPRGNSTRELVGVALEITHPFDRIIHNPVRNFSLRYVLGEWLWYLRGSNSLAEISRYSTFWVKVSDDGETLNSAYGYRIFGHHPAVRMDQWQRVINELRHDQDSRRAVILINTPDDLCYPTKDLPCTQYLQFMIRDHQLLMFCNMRSNDLVFGFSNDVSVFTLMHEMMLLELQKYYPDLQEGSYHHYASSLHVYERHYSMIEQIATQARSDADVRMPPLHDLKDVQRLIELERQLGTDSRPSEVHAESEFVQWCLGQLTIHLQVEQVPST